MHPDFRSWVLATVTLLVVFLILADISELEEEIGSTGGRGTIRSAVESLHSKANSYFQLLSKHLGSRETPPILNQWQN
ncbi:hypothetical protein GDO81_009469 [Engystomops pustulosus]|uniref:Uncharacterized protein n=1 Tax=Engystomops pustulosus TaxID=76066 RepID=A0AAV7BSA2_ENGPU|nr:hypothetical protein GDO81_009469 [Engystomops pustulosus]